MDATLLETAHREMYWHISSPYKYLIYPLTAISLGIFAWGVYKRYLYYKGGRPDPERLGDWGKRIKTILFEIPFQTKVLKDKTGGVIHVAIFWSFLALMFATAVVFVDADFGVPIYKGPFYLFVTIVADLAGLALFGGIVAAVARRYVFKSKKLTNNPDDAWVLALLGAAVVTGFLLEGIRIRYTGDPWAVWSPVGYVVALTVGGLGENTMKIIYQTTWWTHFAALFAFIAALPYTKLIHIFTLPANVFFASTKPKGAWPRVDIEAMMSDEAAMENFKIGANEAADLTWKQRLDYDACIRCGRCESVCPAHLNNKPLSPKQLMADLKKFAWDQAGNGNGKALAEGAEAPLIVGNGVSAEALWECRTCRACMEACPAHIEHVPQIMEMRRGEVMMRGQLPFEASVALKTLERGGNPFGPQEERAQWIADNNIPVIGPGEECEALFWIGCCTTYDCVKQKVAYDVMRILDAAGIKVGVLGNDEYCCGDPARLLGDENLFQSIAKSQIAKIKERKFKFMISHCPHCFNVMKNEYVQFGADFPVYHHTEVINRLVAEGRIKLDFPVTRKITYHDPCYLTRHNDITDEPRNILGKIRGVELVEMAKSGKDSNCCGGGGGHYWMDIPTGERINIARVKEALDTKADTMAVACVFCLQMMNDAVKVMGVEDKIEVKDISELVVMSMGKLAEVKKLALETEEKEEAA